MPPVRVRDVSCCKRHLKKAESIVRIRVRYRVGKGLPRAVKSFYKDSKVGREEREYFPAKICLRHECVMSLRLFTSSCME